MNAVPIFLALAAVKMLWLSTEIPLDEVSVTSKQSLAVLSMLEAVLPLLWSVKCLTLFTTGLVTFVTFNR